MRFSLPTVVVLCTFVPIILSSVMPRLIGTENTGHSNVVLPNRRLSPRQTYGNCTAANTRIRREWWARAILVNFRFGREGWHRARRTLSKSERRSYIDAVLCLQKKPSIYKEVAGAKSRFDDFQVEHITQAYDIHFNVSLSSNSNICESLAYALQGFIHRLASLVCVGIRITIDSGMWLWRRATVGFHSLVICGSTTEKDFPGTGIGPLTE